MLAAPAATAGAICLDRARGTLDHMLMTDLSDTEIVLGKLGARLMPVLGLIACSWPVMSIATLFGGIDPFALTMAFAIIVSLALLGCTLALTVSVWARKPYEVVLMVYTAWGLILLAYPTWLGIARSGKIPRPPAWLLWVNPFYLAYSPYISPNSIEWAGLRPVPGRDARLFAGLDDRGRLEDADCQRPWGTVAAKSRARWACSRG